MWPWWHEIMRKKEKGEIPMEMPGYMACFLVSQFRCFNQIPMHQNPQHASSEHRQ